jgi:predicted RNA-binding Zn-ribbon protein involved in translation (DUF1610 family)
MPDVPGAPAPMTHVCLTCGDMFIIERMVCRLFMETKKGSQLWRQSGTGKNMVYRGDMNREYAMCPRCGTVEHQFSAEARDQTEE